MHILYTGPEEKASVHLRLVRFSCCQWAIRHASEQNVLGLRFGTISMAFPQCLHAAAADTGVASTGCLRRRALTVSLEMPVRDAIRL